jgi:hypothetical protein
MKKKVQRPKEAEKEEDMGVKVDAKFIGPLLSSAVITPTKSPLAPTSPADPQATSLKAKINAISTKPASQALVVLENYDSDASSGKENESQRPLNGRNEAEAAKDNSKGKQKEVVVENVVDGDSMTRRPSSPLPSSLLPSTPPFKPSAAIPASKFYSNSNGNHKKRKQAESAESNNRYQPKTLYPPLQSRTNGYTISNPFNRPINKKRRMGL